jgi:hypothetical protein
MGVNIAAVIPRVNKVTFADDQQNKLPTKMSSRKY